MFKKEKNGKNDIWSDSTESDQSGKGDYPDVFEKFWAAYPKREGKGDAFKAYEKIKSPRPSLNKILESITTHSKTEKWKNKQYIPLPATFLNQRRWEDEFTPEDFNETKQIQGCRNNESKGQPRIFEHGTGYYGGGDIDKPNPIF